ncbi:MAG: alpha/beta fold hydrolase [Novosphingobium sp.]|nr:alpha/beta fold hydrolase [Novosphingobium sp.]
MSLASGPLLLLCGLGSDEDCWRDQANALGATPLVAQGETIEAMAGDVLARAPPRFALAGHSMGGYIALAMMLAAPERVSRLALLNSSAAADDETQRENRLRTIALLETAGLDPLVKVLPGMLSADRDVQDRMAAMLRRAGPARVIREHRACMARPDRRDMLATIAVPALVIGSADDAIVPAHHAQTMAEAIPGARFVMLPQGGHMSIMACADRVTGLLRDWLGRSEPAT